MVCCDPPHPEPMLQKSISAVIIIGQTLTNSIHRFPSCLPPPAPSQSTALHQWRTFLSRPRASVHPLVAFLATVATLALELGGAVLVSGTLCVSLALALALTLIELAVFRCVAGTSAHVASHSSAFTNGVNVHRRRVALGSDSTPRPSLSKIRPGCHRDFVRQQPSAQVLDQSALT